MYDDTVHRLNMAVSSNYRERERERMKKRERTDGRNPSRVKQWPSNEMVKAIDRIPMVCAPCFPLLCSLSLYLLGST